MLYLFARRLVRKVGFRNIDTLVLLRGEINQTVQFQDGFEQCLESEVAKKDNISPESADDQVALSIRIPPPKE